MKREILEGILEELAVPYALMVHRSKPQLPFITYFFGGSNNFFAENRVYIEQHEIGIQIVSDKKEYDLERQLKEKLNEQMIPWEQMPDNYDSKTQTFITQINI